MTRTRHLPLLLLLASLVLTLVPATGAHTIEEQSGCTVREDVAGGGGACDIAYVSVEPGGTVEFDVPSPFDRTVDVRLAVAPAAGRLTQLDGRAWRYDAAGVEGGEFYSWFVVCGGAECVEVKVVLKVKDLTAPDTTIAEGPDSPTLATAAVFVLESDESDVWFKCNLDGGEWAPCTSPLRLDGLAPGDHRLAVKAVDGQGNWDRTPAVWEWVVAGGTFADDESSVHEADIEKLAASGITRGCTTDGTRFCPSAVVTRGQFAAFVNRALELPAADRDHFGDDDGHLFEDDINRLASAGYTAGCNDTGTRFCPDRPVTRGQIAAFLDRVLELPAGPDAFGDDDGSMFESHINALAKAGITRGCGDGDDFCPEQNVTRAQFASLFVRAGFTD